MALVKVNWATEHELRTLKGIVYIIVNTINQKCYIGKTVKTFRTRYRGKNWYKNVTNVYLKNSIIKYKPENFKIRILEQGIGNDCYLKLLESYYIKLFSSLYPNGYNILESDFCIRRPTAKIYKFFHNNFGIVEVENLSKFCRDNSLCPVSMWRILKHKESYKGWTNSQTRLSEIPIANSIPFWLECVDGQKIFIQSLNRFCKENSLNYDFMKRLRAGKIYKYRDYVNKNCLSRKEANENYSPAKEYLFVNENGEILKIKNLAKFARDNKISENSLRNLQKNPMNTYKGLRKYELPNI